MTDPDDPGPSRGPDVTSTTAYEVLVTDDQTVPIDSDALIAALCRGMGALSVPANASLSVTLATREAIADVKGDAFGEHRATDILAFPMDGIDEILHGAMVLGDLVLCPDVALAQAAALGVTGESEIVTLLAHGLLHLVGLDHAVAHDEVEMAQRQVALARTMSGEAA